ncbi:MAG: signal peptidase I [Sedimentisphaerales bacterium]|nr:signal peptidase I [Sedimentisphaerales bacterium]
MSLDDIEKSNSKTMVRHKKDRAAEVADTFEWLITAFILAFVFRAFIMEAFRIPTGSMADTLKGAHFRLRCRQCGYQYEYGFQPGRFGLPEDTVPRPGSGPLRSYSSRCPSCGSFQPVGGNMPVANGDRILVLKCIYQFLAPKRWDVIVFKNPPEPEINYIKRLIGLPGETVQIIDGDIYINGQISRKPPKVQRELWTPVYDNDYQPVNKFVPSFNYHEWQQPFKNENSSKWTVYENSPTLFHLNSPADRINTMEYDTSIGNNFRATYAYDEVGDYSGMPYCSDLMVRFYCNSEQAKGRIGASVSKDDTDYNAWVDFTGEMVITKNDKHGGDTELARKSIKSPKINKIILVKFANVDHQLIFEFGDEKLTYDLGLGLEDAGRIRTDIQPHLKISGSGKLTLSHVAVFRDIHYTTSKYANGPENGRAIDKPFTLDQGEYFVLGDNSPNSEDCRWWTREGLANKGLSPYRIGVVPRDYLVGKALFVYWPSGFRPVPRFPIGIIPNIGRMRFIYGGSKEKL